MKAIAEELASGKYDIVCLQEVWTVNDFNLIRDGVKSSLPYSHYFHRYVNVVYLSFAPFLRVTLSYPNILQS